MRLRRAVAILGCVVSILVLTTQTAAFSVVSADRGVTVEVVDDEDAYLGIVSTTASIPVNETENESIMILTNRLPGSIELTLSATESEPETPPELNAIEPPTSLGSGESQAITGTIRCGNTTATETATVSIRAAGDDVTVVLDRTMDRLRLIPPGRS